MLEEGSGVGGSWVGFVGMNESDITLLSEALDVEL
jgi:hypothetical protein